MEENKLNTLYEAYQGFMSTRNVEWTQKLFNAFQNYTGHSMGSWSCGGCTRRTKEKTEFILTQNGLIDQPRKHINK